MTIKEQVLDTLIQNKGKSLSGEVLAKKLFCSRNAVWKAIESLRNDGYEIQAVTNKGYSLINDGAVFSPASIKKYLNGNIKVIVLDEVDSTNNYLKVLAEKGESKNTVVVAQRQSGGKGRMGRKFFSPKSGVYFSILLKPEFSAEKSLFITTAAAVAVCEAVEKISGRKTGIKWVNDVFINNKKICGILTEASVDVETGGLYYAVLGIGINIYNSAEDFPKELKNIAGTVFENDPNDKEIRQKLAAETINCFFKIYNNFKESDFMRVYKQKSIVIGKKINVIKGEKRIAAKAIDIDNEARLIVEYENGSREALSSGEVSIKL